MSTSGRRGWLTSVFSWRAFFVLGVWVGSLAFAGLAGAYAYRGRAAIRAFFSPLQSGLIIETSLYNLSVQKLSVPAEGREGGIAALADGILFANRLGSVWFVDPDLSLRELSLRIPINYDEFVSDPYNVETTSLDQFAVKDLQVQPRDQGVRLLASFSYWYSDQDCYVLRVGILDTSEESILSSDENHRDQWRTVYETPCRPLSTNPLGVPHPTIGAGGRLAALSDHELLLTVGGFGPSTPKDDSSPFMSTVLIDLASGESRIYTRGHRNPQGLAVSSSGEVWLTEHGERGGDELNRIVEGSHYGFPYVMYGTAYESMVWAANPRQGRHDGYEKPMYSWVPSIGISQAMVIEGTLFEHWSGDIIVSSLLAGSLFRVRVTDGRVVFVEPIPIGHRIRAITERADGTIVLKTDDDLLVFLNPLDSEAMEDLGPRARGQVLAVACAGCHSFERDGDDGIGPNLWGIMGRRVASGEGYSYSEAMRGVTGRWTQASMRSFLTDPRVVVPGTTMEMVTAYGEAEIDDLLAYLRTLR